ncbi:MAG: 4Fe-4S ferredoxin [Chloroflexi bacterium]|nr:4Fe-4S ferredoxin [Chloroflexota bacterium]
MLMLPKSELSAFVAELMADRRVIAPVERDTELRFDVVEDPEQVNLAYRNTGKTPKAVFFPQVETLIRFARERDRFDRIEAVPLDTTPTVLLGVRPCDARSFLFLDRIFAQGRYLDPYYLARRQHTMVVSLACDHPRQTCFCHAFESGPYDRAGADILMREAGDAYLVEAITERGAELLDGMSLATADAGHLARAKEIEENAVSRLQPMAPIAGIESALAELFDSGLWAEVSEKCLACGTCTYVCPACHCFNIEDKLYARDGERVRAWDSCMYPTFTLHASGHNPRPDQAARWRQRMMHKFEYLPRNVDAYGCVGCGRCILSCPVRLDIRQVIARVQAEACKVKA